MWKMFEELTLKGCTLAAIRQTYKAMNDNSLDAFTDVPLLQRMIRICRKSLPRGIK